MCPARKRVLRLDSRSQLKSTAVKEALEEIQKKDCGTYVGGGLRCGVSWRVLVPLRNCRRGHLKPRFVCSSTAKLIQTALFSISVFQRAEKLVNRNHASRCPIILLSSVALLIHIDSLQPPVAQPFSRLHLGAEMHHLRPLRLVWKVIGGEDEPLRLSRATIFIARDFLAIVNAFRSSRN